MKRRLFLLALLLLPVLVMAWHYGPGQAQLAKDNAALLVAAAEDHEANERWQQAMDAYAQAQLQLPESSAAALVQLELRRAKARIRLGELPEAMEDMRALLAAARENPAVPAVVERSIRTELAVANYYAAWIMRLEGSPKEEWSIASDEARQHFRLLAEKEVALGNPHAEKKQENLEAAVRLARMDLGELKGKKLPKECSNCKNVGQKCRAMRVGKCKSKSRGKDKVRDNISSAKGAGSGERTGSGS